MCVSPGCWQHAILLSSELNLWLGKTHPHREDFPIRINTCSCTRPIKCASWKSFFPAHFPNTMLRWTQPGQSGLVQRIQREGCPSGQAPPLCPAYCQLMPPAFLYTTFFVLSLIVCFPTLPGLQKKLAVFPLFSSVLFTNPQCYTEFVVKLLKPRFTPSPHLAVCVWYIW